MAHIYKPQTPPAITTSDLATKSDTKNSEGNRLSASHHAHPTPTPSPISGSQSSPPVLDAKVGDCLPFTAETAVHGTSASESHDVKGIDTPPSSMEEQKSEQEKAQTATPSSSNRVEGGGLSGSGRKRDHAAMSCDDQRSTQTCKSKGPLKRASSVRLSMTAEGAVKIRTNDELTPSPPKERALPPTDFQKKQAKPIRRSISLFEDHYSSQADHNTKPRFPNAGFGRSRDVRTWEFYCDGSSKEALSTQVEAERNGSSVGAINLIRSSSHKSRGPAMSPVLSRANAQVGTTKAYSSKPKMMRAKSSLARLQGSEGDVSLKQGSKQSRHVRSPSGDSDKENWAPGTRMSHNPLRRTQPSNNSRPILQSNESATFRDIKPQSIAAAKGSSVKASAGGDDLDCIQGLLSLSQGAWR